MEVYLLGVQRSLLQKNPSLGRKELDMTKFIPKTKPKSLEGKAFSHNMASSLFPFPGPVSRNTEGYKQFLNFI